MQVHGKLQELVDRVQQQVGAEKLYVVDIDEQHKTSDDVVATVVLGVRDATMPALGVQMEARKALEQATQQQVGVQVLTDPLDEVEYLFDRYLRAYIATHGGIVTPVRIEDPGVLWISMEGGCSGCPSSIATLKHGIERTLKKHLPWVQRVESTEAAEEPDFNIKLNFSSLASES